MIIRTASVTLLDGSGTPLTQCLAGLVPRLYFTSLIPCLLIKDQAAAALHVRFSLLQWARLVAWLEDPELPCLGFRAQV